MTLLNHETKHRKTETAKQLLQFPSKFGIQEVDIDPTDHVRNILEYGTHDAKPSHITVDAFSFVSYFNFQLTLVNVLNCSPIPNDNYHHRLE